MMLFLLNLIFAIIAFFITRYILAELHVVNPVNVLLSLLVAIAIFMLNLAAQIV